MKNNQKGFTVIEMMMAAVIGALIVGATTYVGINLARNYRLSDARLDIQSESRLSLDWLVKDIRSATEIVSTYDVYTTGNSELVLKVLALDDANANDTPDDYKYDYIIYRLISGSLQRIVVADATSERVSGSKYIASNITALTFSSEGTAFSSISDKSTIGSVYISMTFIKSVAGKATSKDVHASVRLRNYDLGSA